MEDFEMQEEEVVSQYYGFSGNDGSPEHEAWLKRDARIHDFTDSEARWIAAFREAAATCQN